MAITALAVVVPEAEETVGALRARHDPSTALGAPAHITILVPFMHPDLLTPQILGEVGDALRLTAAFDFSLARIGRFIATAYLEPEPSAPFVELTCAVVNRFPEFPPFSGEHSTVVPHLTVANGDVEQAHSASLELEEILRQRGPIHARCQSVVMLENSSGRWRKIHEFHLSRSVTTPAP